MGIGKVEALCTRACMGMVRAEGSSSPGRSGSGKSLSINEGKAELILKGLTGKTGRVTSIREVPLKLKEDIPELRKPLLGCVRMWPCSCATA